MGNHRQERGYYVSVVGGFLAGLLMGSLVGAGATLLLAPQSGKKTRAKLQQASVELRDQTVAGVEDVMAQARATGRQISKCMVQR